MRLETTPAGLAIHVERGRRPGLRLESSRSRRMRLVAGGVGVFWARIERGFYGVWTLRRVERLEVVRPIRADEARAGRDIDGWMRWFAQRLAESEASPLSGGAWHLTELAPRAGSSKRSELVPVHRDDGLPGPAIGLNQTLERPRVTYEDWGSCGSCATLPFRDASPVDAARVKSWMKHARAGTLPPLLFWWLEGLESHLLLDGHDRLAAALAVGVTPRVVTLWQSMDQVITPDPKAKERFVGNYLDLFENPKVDLAARRQLNAKLIAQHQERWKRSITLARSNPELDALWNAEVRAVAPPANEDPNDVTPDFLDLLYDE